MILPCRASHVVQGDVQFDGVVEELRTYDAGVVLEVGDVPHGASCGDLEDGDEDDVELVGNDDGGIGRAVGAEVWDIESWMLWPARFKVCLLANSGKEGAVGMGSGEI